jgi:diguanylate cyclase (GGDEF)-like protein/PAS domain S-box-containing protein
MSFGSTHEKYSNSLLGIVKGNTLYKGDSEAAFREITESASRTMDVERASIWMYAGDRASIKCVNLFEKKTASHHQGAELVKTDFPAYFAAMDTDRAIDAHDAHHDSRTCEFSESYLTPNGITSMLDAPIFYEGGTIGVICIEHVGQRRTWTTEEITFAGSLADLVSHAIESQKRKSAEIKLRESKELFRNYAQSASDWFWELDAEANYTYLSDRFFERTGFSPEDIYGHDRSVFINQDSEDLEGEKWQQLFLRLRNREPFKDFEYQIRKADGEIMFVSTNGVPAYDSKQNFIGYRGTGSEITHRRMTENQLLENEKKYRTLVESAPICIHQIDLDGNLMSMNRAGLEMINESDEQAIVGMPYLDAACAEDRARISALMQKAFNGEFSEFEFRGQGDIEFSSNFVPILDSDGKVDHLLGLTQNITSKKRAQNELSYQASHDLLTGLVNRYEFERRVELLISTARSEKIEHALCFMDLDQFKVVNDTCGHIAGDELLRQLGHLLSEVVRPHDTLARLGGDEFGVLIENCGLRQAQRVAAALQQATQSFQFYWKGQTFRIGVSIGLVAINESTANLTELMKQADAACYMAKDLGRNRIHVYRFEDADIAERHGEMQWVTRIGSALEENRFTLFLQSIEPLDNSPDKHYEVLLRMIDEQDNIVPPGAFLPSADRYGLMDRVDNWVVENALASMAAHPQFVEQINFISINLSGQSVTNADFLASIIAQLKDLRIDTGKICFEITETSVISNLRSAIRFISSLKEVNCRFALDDFGSGLSSFGYLKSLPVDFLKIDGMFVKDMVDDPIDYAMVKSINEIGHVMGMKTIAEFVENDAIREKLVDMGVDYAQGYAIGKPRPFEEVLGIASQRQPARKN